MANSIIEVNTGTLRNDVSEIQGELQSLRRQVTALRNAASALGSTWEGNAKTAFMEALTDDINRLETLISAIEKFTNKTSDARTEYDRCENSVSQIIASIKV